MRRDSRFKAEEPKDDEEWLLTFSDMVTLLLTFFIMLASVSKVDAMKLEQMQSGIAKKISKVDKDNPLEQLKIDLQDAAQTLKLDDEMVAIGVDNRGLVLDLSSGSFFEQGSADIKPQMLFALQKIGGTLNGPKFQNFQVEVEGHTDDTPVATERYPTNWELSTARATAALRVFLDTGVTPVRVKAVGYADVMPKVPNRDSGGNPLPINQEVNRRVTVRVYPR